MRRTPSYLAVPVAALVAAAFATAADSGTARSDLRPPMSDLSH